MVLNNRILYSDNGVITDYSQELGDYLTGSATVALETADYLYIGMDLPFNTRYVEVGTANASGAVMSGEYWDGKLWRSFVDFHDFTSVGGKTLAQSGIITFSTDKNYSWNRDDTYESTNNYITGLNTITIYDLYWARFKVSSNLSAGTSIKYVGYKFCNDAELAVRYPDLILSEVYTQFSAGKTNWNEQAYAASELLVNDLRTRQNIYSGASILDWNLFIEPACHQLAIIIFTALGKDYETNRQEASNKYASFMKLALLNVDYNLDGRLDPVDRVVSQGLLHR